MTDKKRPPHRKQTEAPGRKPPAKIDAPRTIKVAPQTWAYAMQYAAALSVERGYIVTLKEALDVIAQEHKELKGAQRNDAEDPL